ncbi:MAG: 30S ribosomal protein S6 [Deltaproteobacteria bacterium]|nr:30S ribosomal protein S6 [Deltaproteobacteria bacterium]
MRHYETLYIISPELGDEDYKAVVTKHTDLIEKEKGVIIKLEEWGKRRFAYELKKFDQGFYVLMDYCGGAEITAEISRALKLDDKVLKYQTIKLDDNVNPEDLIKEAKKVEEEAAKEAVEEAVAIEDQIPEKEETFEEEALEPDQEVDHGIQ